MFGPSPSPFQNSKDAALMPSSANLLPGNCNKADLNAPLYGEGNRSASSLDALSSKAGNCNLPKGLAQQLNVLFPPQTTSAAGYGGSTTSAGYGGSTSTTCHYNQGIGNGSEGGDPGNSHPHGGSNDETGRTPGQRWIPRLGF